MAQQVFAEFVYDAESFTEWVERLEQWFIANDVTAAAKKRALLLSNIGARGYKLLRSLSQNNPTNKSYSELKQLMMEHLHPKPNEIAQRYLFFKRDRRGGESVKDYVAELRKLSEHCNFGNNLQESLRDRFVCGLNDEKVQQRLLATNELTLKLAVDTATAMEAAARSAKQIHNRNTHTSAGEEGSVHKVSPKNHFKARKGQGSQNADRKECFRCGSFYHLADACPKKYQECYKCKTVGHTQAKCRKQDRNKKQGKVYYGGVEDLGQDSRTNEELDLVEEGLNFVTLYRLEAVDIENNEEDSDQGNGDAPENEGEIEDEVRKYKEWIETTFKEYWELGEPRVEGEDDYDDELELEESSEFEIDGNLVIEGQDQESDEILEEQDQESNEILEE